MFLPRLEHLNLNRTGVGFQESEFMHAIQLQIRICMRIDEVDSHFSDQGIGPQEAGSGSSEEVSILEEVLLTGCP